MSDFWYMDVEDRVYSLIKAFTIKDLKKLYPKIMFTSVNKQSTSSTFSHVVYIHELPGVEIGKTVENNAVNSYLSTFEVLISVTEENKDNDYGKKEEVREIAGYIVNAFKRLNFDVLGMPTLDITPGAYTCPMRFRRIIGANDKDILESKENL